MHTSIERLERLLTLTVLLLLGAALSGSLGDLRWQGRSSASCSSWSSGRFPPGSPCRGSGWGRAGGTRRLTRGERAATAWFGVRGVGTLYYVAHAAGEADLPRARTGLGHGDLHHRAVRAGPRRHRDAGHAAAGVGLRPGVGAAGPNRPGNWCQFRGGGPAPRRLDSSEPRRNRPHTHSLTDR